MESHNQRKTEKSNKEVGEGEDPIDEDVIVPFKDTDLEKAILSELPSFVYYSNYGNLSSKIYLPNVYQMVEWANCGWNRYKRKEQVHYVKSSFEFVKLDLKKFWN